MRRVFEERWRDAPQDPEPFDFEARRVLLLGALPVDGEPWLDLGCGAGRFTGLAPARAIGVEVAQAALERARRNVPEADFRLMDGDTIPVAHAAVGLVWCSEVLEHVPDALGLLQECRRVLRPEGLLLLTTPGFPWWRRTSRELDPLGEHLRFFTRRTLAVALEAAGFSEVAVEGRSRLVARGLRP